MLISALWALPRPLSVQFHDACSALMDALHAHKLQQIAHLASLDTITISGVAYLIVPLR